MSTVSALFLWFGDFCGYYTVSMVTVLFKFVLSVALLYRSVSVTFDPVHVTFDPVHVSFDPVLVTVECQAFVISRVWVKYSRSQFFILLSSVVFCRCIVYTNRRNSGMLTMLIFFVGW